MTSGAKRAQLRVRCLEREATSPIPRLEEGETRTIVFGNPVNKLGKYRRTVSLHAPHVNRPCDRCLSLAEVVDIGSIQAYMSSF